MSLRRLSGDDDSEDRYPGHDSKPNNTMNMQLFGKTLTWINKPSSFQIEENGINIKAGAHTDLFIDPTGEPINRNSPLLLFQADEHFQFSARLSANLQSTFDAAALVVYANENCWAKCCYERSPDQQPMLVTVVTNNGSSDDCNHNVLDQESVHVRIAGLGNGVFAFHLKEEEWSLVRYFSLDQDSFQIGFSSQSPLGQSCLSSFRDPLYLDAKLKGLRTGE